MKKLLLCCLSVIIFAPFINAQRTNIKDYVRVEIVPDKQDWTYKVGEHAKFTLRVIRAHHPLTNVELSYAIGPEKMKAVITGKSNMENGTITIDGGTMKTPGFTTCTATAEVDGVKYTNYLNVAFAPEDIQPTTTLPSDFEEFWQKSIDECRKIPLEPLITLLPEQCTPKYNMYHVRFQHYKKGSYFYGTLCVPKASGKYPAVLRVPGAGVKKNKPETELAEMGLITLSLGIHGIPQTLDEKFYNNLRYGVLENYTNYNLDNKEHYYYRRVYTGCVRAVDFLYTLPEFDGENVGVIGASQGGALSVVTVALDKRIKAMVAVHPALCDLTGYLHNRAGGWPAMFSERWADLNNKPEKIETSKYYDVVNFARFLTAPCFFTWGYNDPTCPPTSYYCAYNVTTAPKELFVARETGHWRVPEQNIMLEWLYNKLVNK